MFVEVNTKKLFPPIFGLTKSIKPVVRYVPSSPLKKPTMYERKPKVPKKLIVQDKAEDSSLKNTK